MTTKVTVDAHAGWPVKVRKWHRGADGVRTQAVELVQPNTTQDFYIHDGMSIDVEEMPRPQAAT